MRANLPQSPVKVVILRLHAQDNERRFRIFVTKILANVCGYRRGYSKVCAQYILLVGV